MVDYRGTMECTEAMALASLAACLLSSRCGLAGTLVDFVAGWKEKQAGSGGLSLIVVASNRKVGSWSR